MQQGLVTIVLFHVIRDQAGSAQGLEDICKFLRAHDLPMMCRANAVKAVQDRRKHLARDVEQIANPGFLWDLDENGRPDGYFNCVYAPSNVKAPGGGRVAKFASGAATWIYGPESGKAQLRLCARSADGAKRQITPILRHAEIDRQHQYHWHEQRLATSLAAGKDWQKVVFPVEIGDNIDRVRIQFSNSPPGNVYLSEVSWRVMP